jgi:hypothetical protein
MSAVMSRVFKVGATTLATWRASNLGHEINEIGTIEMPFNGFAGQCPHPDIGLKAHDNLLPPCYGSEANNL